MDKLIDFLFALVILSGSYFVFAFIKALKILNNDPKNQNMGFFESLKIKFDKDLNLSLKESITKLIDENNSHKSLFHERRDYKIDEKRALAKVFVEKEIPWFIKHISKPYKKLPTINIIFTDGITSTFIFNFLIENRFLFSNFSVKFYTNNIYAIQKFLFEKDENASILDSFPITLLPGYSDTRIGDVLGEHTVNSLNKLREDVNNSNGLILGLLSPKWVLVGKNYNNLQICIRGEQRKKIYKTLLQISDVVYVVSALTNVLAVDDTTGLNEINPQLKSAGKYQSFEIPVKKELPILYTPQRTNDNNSNLLFHSKQLFEDNDQRNFKLSLKKMVFDPINKENEFSKEEVFILSKGSEFFGINKTG